MTHNLGMIDDDYVVMEAFMNLMVTDYDSGPWLKLRTHDSQLTAGTQYDFCSSVSLCLWLNLDMEMWHVAFSFQQ